MSALRSWFRGTASSTASQISPPKSNYPADNPNFNGSNDDATGPTALQECNDIEHAMAAAELIMNDNIDGAQAQFRLRKDSSSIHQLGLGLATFMRSILSFEKEVMAEAASQLSDCEGRAWADLKKAQREAEKVTGGSSFWYGRTAPPADTGGADDHHIRDGVSNIYPPGSEYTLVHAEAQLMNAVVAVMHESLTEGIKGFYKLRKAFLSLDGIMESEMKYRKLLQQHAIAPRSKTAKSPKLSEDKMPGSFDESEFTGLDGETERGSDSEEAEFMDASAGISGTQTPANLAEQSSRSGSATPSEQLIENTLADLSLTTPGAAPSDGRPTTPTDPHVASHSKTTSFTRLAAPQNDTQTPRRRPFALDKMAGVDADLFTSQVDIFVHSGANMCFGILLLIISMVPPAFSRLLSIIGFKGDRDRGVRMLWQSTRFPNINGAIAGLILLAYYNGLLGVVDILPSEQDISELSYNNKPDGEAGEGEGSDDVVGYPRERCAALLKDMRARYPDSPLWKLEEARVLANSKRLEEAIAVLTANKDSKMRQITALNNFDLNINTMFSMKDWHAVRDGFLRSVELDNWSHAIYFYVAGTAELELYRDAYHRRRDASSWSSRGSSPGQGIEKGEIVGDTNPRRNLYDDVEVEARIHKKKAEEFFRKAPSVAGRKRFMARQIPFEVFVCRKVQKWEERAAALGIDLADAVGASPAMEMVYLWNGSKRMTDELLHEARRHLAWERCTTTEDNINKMKQEKDELAVQVVADAALLRSLSRVADARDALGSILSMDRASFKGSLKDDYSLPAAHYEMATVAWREVCDAQNWPCCAETATGAVDAAVDAYRQQKADECQMYLEKVAKWESFVLDARFGMRVQVGLDSVRWLKGKKCWA